MVAGIALLLSSAAGAQPPPPPRPEVSAEAPATATDRQVNAARNSPSVVVDPTDARVLVMAARVDAPEYGCELSLSGDGGAGWVGTTAVRRLPPGAERCYAPQVAFDRAGTLYLLFVGLHTAGNVPMGVFLSASDDRGRSFSEPRQVLGAHAFGVRMAIDTSMGKKGRIHMVWLQANADPGVGSLPSGSNPILAAHSDDGGKTFSSPVEVNDARRQRVVAPALALGPDQAVHVVFYDLEDDARDYHGLEGPTWEGTWSLVVASSGDGGMSFAEAGVVEEAVVPAERVLLIFTMPPATLTAGARGELYVAWHDGRNGDPDVFLRRSGDAGRTWGQARRLNDDRPDTLTDQYLPKVAVAPNGRIDAVFYDRRADPNNLYNDLYYTWSDDGGNTFAPNLRLSRASSHSRIGQRYVLDYAPGLVEFGSHPGLVSSNDGAVAAWTDTRNANVIGVGVGSGPKGQDIYSTTVSFSAHGEPR